ncbi:DUF3786 domain-containing protein [Thermincola ferriacetica]
MANYNLQAAYEVAVDKLGKKSPREIAVNSDTLYNEATNTFKVKYINEDYLVTYPDGRIKFADKDGEIPLNVQILILHYLVTANGAPLQNRLISFKELPDGAIYIEPFTRRAVNPMLSAFGTNPEAFAELAEKIGGQRQSLGDISVTIHVFPRVPITYVIWAADDEFPASGNILFDASACHYLPTEDYALVSSLVVYQLCGMFKQRQS